MSTPSELYNQHEKLKDEGDYDGAIAQLQAALGQDENYVMAHLGLAVMYGKVGRHGEAVAHAQKACELEPNEPFNFTAMSVTCQRASQGADNAADNMRFIRMAEDAMARAHALQGRG
ncbi:MAG: tetratricopeptide repeat protein [Planctomycetales bacterium]|nr:tetratricopeptide repeat protein [Planctomycetales bacterium]